MPKARDIARLHPKTVENHHHHVVRTPRKGTKTSQVTTIRVDMRVWKEALRLAEGDQTRIIVRSEIEVVVVNQSKKGSVH